MKTPQDQVRTTFEIKAKSRRHFRLVRGRLYAACMRCMSKPLADSVIRTWERKQSTELAY